MEDGNESEAIPEVEVSAEEAQQQEHEAAELKAREIGWVPKDEWKGDPSNHFEAEDFIKRGESYLPFVKKNLKESKEANETLKAELTDLKGTMADFSEYHNGVEKRAYEKARQELVDQRTEAVTSGDGDAFTKIDQELTDLDDNKPKEAVAVAAPKPEEDPVYLNWLGENDWYANDAELHDAAESLASIMSNQNPNLNGKQFFDEVTRRVKVAYPQKFTNGRRDAPPSVEGAPGGTARRSGKKSYADLPPEAKKACDKFIKDIPGFKKETYLEQYDWR